MPALECEVYLHIYIYAFTEEYSVYVTYTWFLIILKYAQHKKAVFRDDKHYQLQTILKAKSFQSSTLHSKLVS